MSVFTGCRWGNLLSALRLPAAAADTG